ncbi:hypothetical protein ACERK3_14885 [Phycisphaerales bacterium AB-hyl4]|uniref:Uncharacterized protein n=1 Tax=Natronomicrosphaera hydrolytica TaxID=3242702 RepID=A0ABV4UB62_9BACT
MPRLLSITAALLLLAAPAVHADSTVVGPVDPNTAFGPMTIDQGVGDLDPVGTSLRRLEPGNAMHSTRVRLHRQPGAGDNPGQPQIDPTTGLALPSMYRYSAPGVNALFDRPDYVMKTGTGSRDMARNVAARPDGAFIEAVPAGTIFDLRPESAYQHLMAPFHTHTEPEDWQDMRVDHRYRIDGRANLGGGERGDRGEQFDRSRHPHIPPDTEIPARLPRRFDPEPKPEPTAASESESASESTSDRERE